MVKGFKYVPRSEQEAEKRANQQGGDYESFIMEDFETYKPRKGENWVRIFPATWEGAKHYGMDVHTHYGVGPQRAAILCNNKMFSAPCCICDARNRMEREGADPEDIKELRVVRRVLVWLVDMKDEDKGPQAWAMPWTVDRDISKVSKDKRSGKHFMIDSPDDGYDIYFDKVGEKRNTEYTGFTLDRTPSSVRDDHMQFVVDNPLDTILLLRDEDEVETLFNGGSAIGKERQKAAEEPKTRRGRDDEPTRGRGRDEPEPRGRGRDRDDRDEREEPKEEARSRRRDPDPEPEPEATPRRGERVRVAPPRDRDEPAEDPPFEKGEPRREEPSRRTRTPDREPEPEPERDRGDREERPAVSDRQASLRARFAQRSGK